MSNMPTSNMIPLYPKGDIPEGTVLSSVCNTRITDIRRIRIEE